MTPPAPTVGRTLTNYAEGICRVTPRVPGGGQSGECFLTIVRYPGAVTEELAAAVDGGALYQGEAASTPV